jgi:hypothetical protein
MYFKYYILIQIILYADVKYYWPGVGLFLQNVFIFLGSLTYKFGRSEDNWS